VNVRVIASTNRDLEAEARAGRFREDLYYRLAVVELVVPPLREHPEDIPDLAAEFTRRYAERFGVDVRLSPALVEKLTRSAWPGNVRQLENCVARIVALSGCGEIGADALAEAPAATAEAAPDPLENAPPETLSLKEQLDVLERSLVVRMLTATCGNQSQAARRLGISRSALIERIHKYRL
jgi:two-component system response regulator AtoC